MKTIVLDPGHGGADPGATGNGLLEKHVNLELALGLAEKLKNYDAKILLTRTGDYRLDERAELDRQERAYMANRADADLFYSIHRRAERAQSKRGCKKVVPGKGGLYSSLLLILLGWADDLYSFSFYHWRHRSATTGLLQIIYSTAAYTNGRGLRGQSGARLP